MVQLLSEIVCYCDERLNVRAFEDNIKAYNGLQFQNSEKISKIASAVDVSLESIEKAVQIGADLLLVHHGLFWMETVPVTNFIYQKYKLLMGHNIAVYSCHLPLDAHLEIGNNAILAKMLGLINPIQEFEYHGMKIGIMGDKSIRRPQFKTDLEEIFPHIIAMEFGSENIKKIGIVSGGSGDVVIQAKDIGADAMVIGECPQYQYNIFRENGLNVYACGHYATEIFGVEALGKELAQRFSLPFEFIHMECPL